MSLISIDTSNNLALSSCLCHNKVKD